MVRVRDFLRAAWRDPELGPFLRAGLVLYVGTLGLITAWIAGVVGDGPRSDPPAAAEHALED